VGKVKGENPFSALTSLKVGIGVNKVGELGSSTRHNHKDEKKEGEEGEVRTEIMYG